MTRRDILSAVPTSFRRNGDLDMEGTKAILRHVAASGNEGAFILGTTGEFPAVDDAEFEQVVTAALETLGPTMRVVVHVGSASAHGAVRRARIAQRLGARHLAAITPYYLAASDDAIHGYYEALSAATAGTSLFAYVFPARTGNPVSTGLMSRLAALPGMAGAKLSGLSLADIAAYRSVVPEGFLLYTGEDRDLLAAEGAGAHGVVSGVSAVLPKPFRALAAAAENGDPAEVGAAQEAVDDVVTTIGGDMARMKAAYRIMGIADGACRMALREPRGIALTEIERVVAAHR